MAIDPIRMLTFDVFGTVVDWYGSVQREGQQLAQELNLPATDWGAFALAWRGRYGPSMKPVVEGTRPWVRLDVLHRENLIATLAEFRITLTDAQIDHFNRAWHRLTPWPDSPAGLTRLKTRFTIATLSNGHIELIVNMAKRGGLPWDVVLGAEPAQQFKPHRDTYLKSAEIMGLAPHQCIMVAAHPSDLRTAAALGFGTAYIHRPLEFGPATPADMPDTSDFQFSAASLLDLADQLGC